jgi:protein-tyrosine sulfotransferase
MSSIQTPRAHNPMTQPNDGREPIFILSCERSGSTLLRIIIDTHSEIVCPGQLYLGPTCSNLYKTIYYSLGQRFSGCESERVARVLQEVRAIVGNVMERYAFSRNKRIWCEKTTLNVDYLEILSDVFPNAKYLCLYRNCMDVVQSCLKFSSLGFMGELAPYVSKAPESLVGAMAESWLDKNKRIFEFEANHQSQCLRVSYENVTSNPHTTLPAIFQFLGVRWEADILEKIFLSEHDRGEGDLKVHFSKDINTESIGRGRSIPLTAVPDHLQLRINAMNECLGYDSLERFYRNPQADQSAATPADRLDVDGFFQLLTPEMLSERRPKVANLRGVCQFVVEGDGGGSWTIDLSGADSLIRKEQDDLSADCTIAITHSALSRLVEGTASVGEVYERGQVSVRGSEHLALQFAILLFG